MRTAGSSAHYTLAPAIFLLNNDYFYVSDWRCFHFLHVWRLWACNVHTATAVTRSVACSPTATNKAHSPAPAQTGEPYHDLALCMMEDTDMMDINVPLVP